MPVTKERPHIIDLLTAAANQRRALEVSKNEMLARPLSIWFTSEDVMWARREPLRHRLYTGFMAYSRICERIATTGVMKVVRAASWCVLFIALIGSAPILDLDYDTRPTAEELQGYSSDQRNYYYVSVVINVWLLINSILHLSGLLIRTKVEKAFSREMSPTSILFDAGILAIVLDILCLIYGVSQVGLWFQVARLLLLTQFVLDLFPTIGILMSGIGNGIKSVSYTILLLFLLCLSYGVMGYDLFRENDPLRFGNYALSVMTFFQICTFESWGEVFYVNFFGCDKISSHYSGNWNFNLTSPQPIITNFGIFYAPVCFQPHGQPVASSLIFVTFEVLAGYVIVSMCLAAVAIGINERLEELRSVDLWGLEDEDLADEPESVKSHKKHHHHHHHHGKDKDNEMSTRHSVSSGSLEKEAAKDSKAEVRKRKQQFDGKAAKMLGGNVEGRKIKENLGKVWDLMRKGSRHKFFSSASTVGRQLPKKRQLFGGLSLHNLTVKELTSEAKFLMKDFTYQMTFSALILASAVAQFYNDTQGDNESTTNAHLAFQIIFLCDSAMRFLAHHEKPIEFFTADYWNAFDLTVTVVLFVPTLSTNKSLQVLEFLRVFRMARVLQIASSFSMDLHVVISALYYSAISVSYVILIIFVIFSYFGIIGILLFKEANPFYFSSYPVAVFTLFEVMTLDSWGDNMRYGMLGCSAFPYGTEQAHYCDGVSGEGVGWFAAAYYVIFIIVATYVLSNLLVGVIITSMELLREGIVEETEIWEKVRKVQKRYKVEQTSIDLLLELFENADTERVGIVTYELIETMMSTMGLEEDDLFVHYNKVDRDKNGQLDFSEFSEFILLVGPMYNERKDEEERQKREEKKRKEAEKKEIEALKKMQKSAVLHSADKLLHHGHGHGHDEVAAEGDKSKSRSKTAVPKPILSRQNSHHSVSGSRLVGSVVSAISDITGSVRHSLRKSASHDESESPDATSHRAAAATSPDAKVSRMAGLAATFKNSTGSSSSSSGSGSAGGGGGVGAGVGSGAGGSGAPLIVEDLPDDFRADSHAYSTTITATATASDLSSSSAVVESKEDPLRVVSSKPAALLLATGSSNVGSPQASQSFLSRIARIYAIADDEHEEHGDWYHHGL